MLRMIYSVIVVIARAGAERYTEQKYVPIGWKHLLKVEVERLVFGNAPKNYRLHSAICNHANAPSALSATSLDSQSPSKSH